MPTARITQRYGDGLVSASGGWLMEEAGMLANRSGERKVGYGIRMGRALCVLALSAMVTPLMAEGVVLSRSKAPDARKVVTSAGWEF